jgi:acetolactate synthase-1/2/3 large subunit
VSGPAITAADRMVTALEQLGVEIVFGLPGVHNLPIWKSLVGSPIRLVGVRHEQAAVYAADGYARATGRLGVALVTTGPGAANTLGATGEAMASCSPVLVIATDIPAAMRRPGVYRGVLHETRDQAAMFGPVTKAATTVQAAGDLAADVIRAAQLALTPSTGPVYLGVPTDFLALDAGPAPAPREIPAPPAPADSAIADALALLDGAGRVLIWAGGGALRSGAGPALGALASALAAPVVTTYGARGLLPPQHPCAVPGPIQDPLIGPLWDEADVVLAVGTDFDGMMTQNWAMPAPPRLVVVNLDEADGGKNYPADVTIVGDAAEVSRHLAARVTVRPGLERLRARLDWMREEVVAAMEKDDAQAAAFVAMMEDLVPDDAVVVADMCIPGYWLGGYRSVRTPRTFAYPVGWGTLGFGFPASMGAALAGRGRAVCVTGDGGFLFACGELATVAQEQMPLTIVLVDDGGYGMLRFDQIHAGDETFGVDLLTPDFAVLAQAFGIPAQVVEGVGDELAECLAQALQAPGPNLIVVKAGLRPPPTTSPRWHRRRAIPTAIPEGTHA